MTSARLRPLVAGNWKMNGLLSSLAEAERMRLGYDAALQDVADLMICPPATMLSMLAQKLSGGKIQIGAQDCHVAVSGAHTGDISAEMLADAGAGAVILGHSERRADHGETSALVREKTEAAWRAGLSAIVCIGETRAERDAGKTLDVVSRQLAESISDTIPDHRLVVAYEPVWAIGTGLTPTAADVAEVHGALRQQLVARFGVEKGGAIRLLYGGSVKPSNARELLSIADVNGALVGGASLKAEDFLGIARAYVG